MFDVLTSGLPCFFSCCCTWCLQTHGGHPLVEPPGPDGEAGRETRRVHVYSREWALQVGQARNSEC